MRTRVLSSLILVALMMSQTAVAQKRQPQQADKEETVELKANLVELRAVVTDRKGQLVDSLSKEDFEVLEDGKPQELSFFSVERVEPREERDLRRDPDEPPPAIEPPSVDSPPLRSIVLFVDNLHLNEFSLTRVKKYLKEFIDDYVTSRDLVAVVTTYGSLGVLQQFMSDRAMLRYAVDRIGLFVESPSLFSPYLASLVSLEDADAIATAQAVVYAEEGVPVERQIVIGRARQVLARAGYKRKAVLATLQGVADYLSEMPGQRLVILLSDGFSLHDVGGQPEHQDLRLATGRAARSGVVIHSISAKGLSVPANYTASFNLPGAFGAALNLDRYVNRSESEEKDVLRQAADDTGGRAYLNSNDLDGPLRKVLDSNRVYYVLAYYSDSTKKEGKYQKVSVRLKNRPDYSVNSQKGYVIPSEKKGIERATPTQRLVLAMTSPLPRTELSITSRAAFLERELDDSQVSLQVRMDGGSFQYRKRNDEYALKVEVAVAVYDSTGKLAQSFKDTVSGDLAADHFERARQNGFRYDARLKLKPGLYQVRVGVREADSELMGTSVTWVEVPDLRKKRLALSSLFLARAGNDTADVGKPVSRRLIDIVPFRAGETALYRLVAYNVKQSKDGQSEPTMRLEVLNGDEKVYEGEWHPISSHVVRSDRMGHEIGGRLEFNLEPGLYEVRVSVKDAGSKRPIHQSAVFEVVP